MKAEKRRKLAAAGWEETTVKDFLNLSEADVQYIEMKLALSRLLRSVRERCRLTQTKAATLLKTSQSRFARMKLATPPFLSTCSSAVYSPWVPPQKTCSKLPDSVEKVLNENIANH